MLFEKSFLFILLLLWYKFRNDFLFTEINIQWIIVKFLFYSIEFFNLWQELQTFPRCWLLSTGILDLLDAMTYLANLFLDKHIVVIVVVSSCCWSDFVIYALIIVAFVKWNQRWTVEIKSCFVSFSHFYWSRWWHITLRVCIGQLVSTIGIFLRLQMMDEVVSSL